MAINRVAGQMLKTILERDGNNLSFADTANSTPALYLDIANTRVGINASSAGNTLDVIGSAYISSTASATTLIAISANIGNLEIANTTIASNSANLVTIAGTAALVIPAGNTDQRPSPPPTGAIRINTALGQIEAYDGIDWITGSGGGGNLTVSDQQITPDGSTVTYTLDQDTNQASILVTFNGVTQIPGVAYTVTGNSITFAQAPQTTDIIDVRFLASASTRDKILNTTGNTKVQTYDNSTIVFTAASSNVITITSTGLVDFSSSKSLQLPTYTVAQAANISGPAAGQLIYVSNGDTGNPCLAVYSGGAWKRISFGANIST